MIFKKLKKNKGDENENRLRVLLALAGRKFADPGPCPDPNDMAAFAQGSIDSQKRKMIEAHLKVCRQCREEYRNFTTIFGKPLQQNILLQIKNAVLDFGDRFNISRSTLTAGLTSATITCLVMLFLELRSPTLSDQLTETFTHKVLTLVSTSELKSNNMVALPWESPETALGFASLQQVDPNALLAFGAGICSARNDLAGKSETVPPAFKANQWPDTQWAVDYWLGRWSYLTRAVAISGEIVEKAFWQKQIAIVNQFQNKYADAHKEDEETIRIVNVRLNHIKSILSEANNEIFDRSTGDHLSDELSLLIELLSPGQQSLYNDRIFIQQNTMGSP